MGKPHFETAMQRTSQQKKKHFLCAYVCAIFPPFRVNVCMGFAFAGLTSIRFRACGQNLSKILINVP